MRNLSCDNEFHLHQKKKTFHTSGFALSRDLGKLNLRSDVFLFFLFKSAQGVSDIYRDNRETARSQAWGNSEMASKMRKQQQQQTSKELNDASLSLFICC